MAESLRFDLADPWVIVGLLVGGAMPFVFASFCMSAVGKAGKAVERVVDGLWRVWGWLTLKLTICLPYRVRAYESRVRPC